VTHTLTGLSVVSLPSGVRLKEDSVRDRVVLLAPERALVVDAIGQAILNEVDGVKSVDAIADALALRYQADKALIMHDVLVFLTELSLRRMVETAS
jgi:pyrroloquinoline quinone biosynthesis protein D